MWREQQKAYIQGPFWFMYVANLLSQMSTNLHCLICPTWCESSMRTEIKTAKISGQLQPKQQVLLYSTGNYIQLLLLFSHQVVSDSSKPNGLQHTRPPNTQHPIINHSGKEYEKIHMCITETLCCTLEINRTLYINVTSIFKKF